MAVKWTRVKNNSDGNARYVCHFLNLLTETERSLEYSQKLGINSVSILYNIALHRAHKINGRKFHNKQYGGGIVFNCISTEDKEEQIKRIIEKESK